MKALLLTLVVALFTVPLGCDRGDEAAAAGATSATTIKLLDAGKGPKRLLRFTAQKGMKKTLLMTMEMGMTMNLDGVPRTQKIPAIKVALEIVIIDVAKNGDIRYDFTLLAPEVVADTSTAPQVVEAIKSVIAGMTGLSGNAVITSRGFTKEADLKLPAGANAQLTQFVDSIKQSIRQMSAPVPAEEVGVGAKWDTTMKLASNGMHVVQVATTELVSLEGNVMTLKLAIAQSAAPQKITSNGTTVDLSSFKSSGSGDSRLDLGQLVPTKASVTMKSEMEMKVGAQKMEMGIDLAMVMSSR